MTSTGKAGFAIKVKLTVRVNRLVHHAQKTEWWLMVVQILALATYTELRGSFANLVARGCITQWWQLDSSMSIVMLLSAIAACNLLKLTYKLRHMGWHYNLCHIQLSEHFSHPDTLWYTNPGYELISEYNRGLTYHRNKFHGTFHSIWSGVGSSCCTMLKSPSLCLK